MERRAISQGARIIDLLCGLGWAVGWAVVGWAVGWAVVRRGQGCRVVVGSRRLGRRRVCIEKT